MIPVLYKADESRFVSNGIGRLKDALDCTVTEERNGIYELNMTYPVTGAFYEDIKPGCIILAKPSWTSDPQPFDIKSVTPAMDGMKAEIYGQHISYRLSGIPVKPFTANGITAALNGLITNAMTDQGFSVWTDISNDTGKFTVSFPKSFRSCLFGSSGSILQTFSGSGSLEYEFDKKQIKVYRHRGTRSGMSIRYGKNLTSLKQETSIENTYTGVLAYWTDDQTEETVTGDIQYADNHDKYANQRIYILDASNDFQSDDGTNNKPSVDDLNGRALKYIESNDIGIPSVNLEVSFVDLSQSAEYKNSASLERVNLCDTVTVKFNRLGVDAEAKVIKTVWNVLKDRYDSIELGDEKITLDETIEQTAHDVITPEIKQTKSVLQQAIDAAADLLRGGTAGHMVIGTNADNEANELYFMDTDNKATAKNVLRINMNGIAFSKTGINGPYTSAWTIDGAFNADFITAGTLRANLIKAGVLSDEAGKNSWNMETGELHLSAESTVGDSKIASQDDVAKKLESYYTKTEIDVKNDAVTQSVSSVRKTQATSFTVYHCQTDEGVTPSKNLNENGWTTGSVEWKDGKHIWSMTATTFGDGTVKYSDPVDETGKTGAKGEKGADGADAISLIVDSSNGLLFKNSDIATILNVTVIVGEYTITDSAKLKEVFGSAAKLLWKTKQMGDADWTDISPDDSRLNDEGFLFTVSTKDVKTKCQFTCELDA